MRSCVAAYFLKKSQPKSKGTANTPVNHDSVMLSGDGDTDFEGDADAEDSDDDIDLFEEKRYEKTKSKNWTKHENGRPWREIHPIPFTGLSEFFRPNLSDDEVKGMMMDAHGDIRYHKIFEWMLPMFEGVSFYEFLSARMRNYMLYSIKDNGWTPLYYCPADGKVISADDVAHFFGCQLARSLRGNPPIQRTWSTHESLDSIGTCMECMSKNAFQDIYTCLHFDDDWDGDDEWDDVYADSKKCSPEGTAKHRQKFSMLEDGFNRRWKECTTFRRWPTFDESHVAGWYHSPITQGPDPKPIRTGATIHSLAITHGDLASYKVHVHARARSEAHLHRRDNPLSGNIARRPHVVQSARSGGVWWSNGLGFGQRLHGRHYGNDWPRCLAHQHGRNGASKPYRRQRRLHKVDEEGNV